MVFLITAASRTAFNCSNTALGSVAVLELAYHGKRPNAGSAHYYLVKQSPVPGSVSPLALIYDSLPFSQRWKPEASTAVALDIMAAV
jgi:hypothetical protein